MPTHHTRDDVVAVAEQLFCQEGAQALSVRRIAEALGVSRQIVYSRFTGKPDLVRALHNEGFRRLTARFAAVPGPSGTSEHILAMGRAYREAALASPALYGLMFGRPVAEFEPDHEARAVAIEAFAPVLAAARAWLQTAGLDASDRNALHLARTIWAATHGVVSLEVAGLLGTDGGAAIARILMAIIDQETRSG